ncbi:MAG: serine hydrolase [Oscillospiraceae bacterium]|nr:serine hydrolase [Oscillospiraceae bacterium]
MSTTKKIVIFFIFAAMLFSNHPSAYAATIDEPIIAAAALMLESESGEILYESNSRQRHPAADFARVMTLFLAIYTIETGEADPDALITMTDTAWDGITQRVRTQNISPGEEMTLLDLMYCAFVGSAGEACNMIAEHIAGSVDEFINMMNARARELGASNTHFTNTHGLHSPYQFTTAFDLYIILREAMSFPLFVEIAGTHVYTVEETNLSGVRRLTSTNPMLNANSPYYYRYCLAGMASFTYEGGYSFLAFAEREDLSLISIVLGSDAVVRADQSVLLRNISETQRLFDWGFSEFSWRDILTATELVGRAAVANGAGADFINLRPERPITHLLPTSVSADEFVRTITIFSNETDGPVYAPIYAGQVLGEINLSRRGVDYGTVRLIANTSIELHRFDFFRMQITSILSNSITRTIIAILAMLVLGYVALVIRYNRIRRTRLRKIAEAKRKLIEERMDSDMHTMQENHEHSHKD